MSSAVGPIPTIDDVARIAAIRDRVLRNLEITACYAELSTALRARVGPGADWCTFATWASRQAGSTIRGEDFLDRLGRRLRHKARLLAPVQSLHRWLLRRGVFEPQTRLGRVIAAVHTPFDAFERASEAVAEGNLKVFEEIAYQFARFLAEVPPGARADSDAFRAFSAGLRPGGPPDGQQLLTEAFAHYQQARDDADPAGRAAWILLANLKIGLHEQTRLQPQIAGAIDAPLTTARDLGARVLHAWIPGSRRWPRLLQRPAGSALGLAATGVRRAMTSITREIITEALMVLALPTGVLSLGRDLDAPVPPVFAGTTHAALLRFIAEHDPCAPGTSRCGAEDWCDLRQRMHYILHLFRAYAEEPALFRPPFTPGQIVSFRSGVIPEGEL